MKYLYSVWTYGRWVLVFLVLSILALAVYRIPFLAEQEKTAETVAFIESRKITMSDVDGSNLPPPVDAEQANATIEGIDLNQNGIRDDVEREIFKRYPDDIKTRAAALQYAMAQRLYFTSVFSAETLNAVNLQNDRATFCLWNTIPIPWKVPIDFENLSTNELEKIQELSTVHDNAQKALSDEIDALMLNNASRKNRIEQLFEEYYDGGGTGERPYCDIDLSVS